MEAQGGAAEVLEAAVDSLGGAVAGAGSVEVGQHVLSPLHVVDLGIDARRPLTQAQIDVIAAWRARDEVLATATARGEATRLAKRVAALDKELKEITKRITNLVRQSPAGGLLDQPGIGPVTTAVALTSWSHLRRIRSEVLDACPPAPRARPGA